jgi:ubiquitin-conjugating enzyme E2 S
MASENLAPQVISRLMSEIRDLIRNPPEGIEYIENEENSVSEIYAMVSGPEETPFFGGRFRMKLVISEEYPNVPPKGYFLTKIFHPNVATNGDICVNTLKRDWNPQVTLKHILQVIRCLLIIPFPESSLNDEAGKLFMESYEEYAARARIMTEVHALSADSKIGKAGDVEGTLKGGDVPEEVAQKKKEKEVKKKNLKRL